MIVPLNLFYEYLEFGIYDYTCRYAFAMSPDVWRKDIPCYP